MSALLAAAVVVSCAQEVALPERAAAETSTKVDPRDLPALASPPAPVEARQPADPKADFAPLAGKRGSSFDPQRSTVVSRSMFVDEYRNPDGTHTVVQSSEPRNVRDAAGQWQPVDTALRKDSGRVRPGRHPLSPTLAEFADDPALVSVEVGGRKVGLGVERAAKGRKAEVRDKVAAYPGVAADTDLEYEVTPGSVKETIKLRKPPSQSSWRFRLDTGGLVPAVTAQGSVTFTDPATGAVTLTMPPVVTWDNATPVAAVTGGSYALEQVGQQWVLTVSVDQAWLRDPKRVYPVSVDPTFTFGVTNSHSYKSDGYECQNCGLQIGNALDNGDKYWRSAFKVDYTPLFGKTVVGARLDVKNQRGPNGPDKTWNADIYHASKFAFDGLGGYLGNGLVGQVGSLSGDSLTSFLRTVVDKRDPYAYFMLVGAEVAGSWTYKNLSATLLVDTGTAAPAATLVGPADNTVTTSLTPTLAVNPVTDADGDPVTYCFRVATGADAKSGVVVDSGCLSGPTWTVPPGVLQDGVTYTWQVQTASGITLTPSPVWRLKVDQRIGQRGPAPGDTVGPITVNLANGNTSTSAASPTFTTVGGTAGVTMTYNSQQKESKGLKASYFQDLSQKGEISPSQQPVLVRTEPQVNVDWGLESPFAPALPADWFVARWEGFFQAPAAGTYQFAGRHDDGLKVWVDNKLAYDQGCCTEVNWTLPKENITLAAGQRVPIKVELAERTGYAFLRLFVRTTDDKTVPPQIVPADWLSTSDLPALPTGWTLSSDLDGTAGGYTESKVTDQTIVLTDASGAKHTWTKKSTGGYTAPEGEDGVLGLDTGGRVTLTEGSDVFVFRPDGKLETQSTAADSRKPATLQNIYDGSPSRLREIKDPVSGRAHRLQYNRPGDDCYGPASVPPGFDALPPAQMLCRITYWDGTETRLWYSGGRLARVEDPGSELTDYRYGTDGYLSGVRDNLVSDWIAVDPANRAKHTDIETSVDYDVVDGKPKANQVRNPAGTPGQTRTGNTYSYDTAARTSLVKTLNQSTATGWTTKVTYDDADRLLTTTDATGKVTKQVWNVKDQLLWTTDPAGRRTSTVYDGQDRVTDTYGPAPESCFDGQLPKQTCTVPHEKTNYDEGLKGLAIAWYNNNALSGSPAVHTTGIGTADGTLAATWPNAPTTGVNADFFSLRATGEIEFPAAGEYTLRAYVDDGIRLWIDDVNVINDWRGTLPEWRTAKVRSDFAGQVKRIRLDYMEVDQGAKLELHWTTPSGTQELVPGARLRPRYGLTTSTVKDESLGVPNAVSTTKYDGDGLDANYGLAISKTTAGSSSKLGYEPVGTGYLRRTSKSQPTGARTSYTFYGATETRDNPCTTQVEAINQGGLVKTTTTAAPATGPARVDDVVYDASGREVAKGAGNDWTCTEYDARDRVVKQTFPGSASAAERTVRTAFAVGGDPLVTSVTDEFGTVTTQVDLQGRTVAYTDVQGTKTETAYDAAGRVAETKVTPPNAADKPQVTVNTYDDAGRVLLTKLDGAVLATSSYDAAGELSKVDYSNGSSLSAIGKDEAGRVTSHTWRTSDGTEIVSAVDRTRAGTIVDERLGGVDARPNAPNYIYDGLGRLTEAWVNGHHYTYDFTSNAPAACPTGTVANAGLNTNRVRLLDETASGTAETGYCYDNADRVLATTGANPVTNVKYDDHGSTTEYTVGGATTHFAWDGAERNVGVSVGGSDPANVAYTRDSADRIIRRHVEGGDTATDVLLSYTGASDNPTLVLSTDKRVLTRTLVLPGGVVHTTGGDKPTWDHPSVRGDLCLTTDTSGKQSGALRTYSPFGEPLAPSGQVDTDAVPDNMPGQMDYGWLGQKQRPYEHAGSLSVVQMGARPYSPLLGRFLTVDPVEGGSANDYDYVNADPINETDIDGRCSWKPWSWGGCAKKAAKWVGRQAVSAGKWAWRNKWTIASVGVGAACVFVTAGTCLAAGGVLWAAQTGRDIYRNQFSWKRTIGNGLLTLGGGFAGRAFAGAWRARNVVNVGRHTYRHAGAGGGHRRAIAWGRTGINWGFNAALSAVSYWASNRFF